MKSIRKIGIKPIAAQNVGLLRKRLPGDSIIAATVLFHHLPSHTNNTADFEDFPGLRVVSLPSIS
ncbi:PIN domain-containing protein [Larkinella harenae]